MLKAELFIMATRYRQSGFTLLEVLITLIVLSVGLLGLAGLQTMSLRNNHDAYLRSQVISQIYDIVDRMRANSARVDDVYNMTNTDYTFDAIGQKTENCDKKVGCTTSEMAAHDLFNWNQSIRNSLPQGIGIVCRDGSMEDGNYAWSTDQITPMCSDQSTDPLVIKIWWVDDHVDPPVARRFSTVIGDKL